MIISKRIDLQEIVFSRRESVFQGVLFYTITSRPWFGLTVDIPDGGELTIGKHLFKLPEVLKNEPHETST